MDEESLIGEARAGSRPAFEQLVRLHQGNVRSYLGRHLRDQDMADDLAQEVFLAAFHSLPTYEGDAPLAVWLIGIARHRALAFLRGEARRRARESHRLEAALAGWRVAGIEEDAGGVAQADTRRAALRDCLKQLPEKSARIVEQRYFRQTTAAEIARSLDTTEFVVRTTLVRIRQALRRCIAGRLISEGSAS